MKIKILFILFIIPFAFEVFATTSKEDLSSEEIRSFLKTIFDDNRDYVKNLSREQFKSFAEQQTPRATVLSCSDSRIQTDAFHKSPVNDLFFIRNIGNQITTAEGSIEYGVNHLHTPVLLIIGHTHCGAIEAALSDYQKETPAIRKELDDLHLTKKNVPKAILENVNNQVALALKKFKSQVDEKKLIVLGVIYDFRDDLKRGHGRLTLVNINGQMDPSKIKENDLLKGIEDVSIGYYK